MSQTTDIRDRHPAPLTPDRAFVVQLRAHPPGAELRIEGRVEHVTSGKAAHFRSMEELAAFLARTAAELLTER